MNGNRRLHHESLESRRLLAANCLPIDETVGGDTGPLSAQFSSNPSDAEGESTTNIELDSIIGLPDHFFRLPLGPDLVQEHGDRVFIVDQQPLGWEESTLYIFERADDGSLETVTELAIGFSADRMIVSGDQVLLFGNKFDFELQHWIEDPVTAGRDFAPRYQTVVTTVNVGENDVVVQEIEGVIKDVHLEGERLVMVSATGGDVVIAIYPPPPIEGLVQTFDITADGLRPIASRTLPLNGTTAVHDQDFYATNLGISDIHFLPPAVDATGDETPGEAASSFLPYPASTVAVSRFALGDDAISEAGQLELGRGFVSDFKIAPDGEMAIAIRTDFGGIVANTHIDMLDLSGDSISLFESVPLVNFSGQPLIVGPDFVVLRSYGDDQLVIVDTNQAIDINALDRVRRVRIPDGLSLHFDHLRVSDDRLAILADRILTNDVVAIDFNRSDLVTPDVPRQTVLLTVSIPDAEIIADTNLPNDVGYDAAANFVEIDADAQRLGFFAHARETSDANARFVFGHLNDSGEFVSDGSVPVGRWLEIDANADRLIVREQDRLLEYDWENIENPIVTPLGDPDPTIEAVDDAYALHADGQDQILDVLANDKLHHAHFGRPARIVELVGAPEGSEIIGGHLIMIPAAALEGGDSLRFEYVISDNDHRSSAVVEIEVLFVDQNRVRELVEEIRERAADDFGVPLEEIEVTSIERIFGGPLPVVLPGDPPTELDLSPGILVTLVTSEGTALYAASLEGEIIQVFASQRQFLLELGLDAVDASGETLQQVTEGDQFWLEFNARDLREFGLGVYAAFFDLIVPTEHLVITGSVEFGPDFTSILGGEIDRGEIDDIGAISNVVESPGNDRQTLLRIGVRAVGAGQFTLKPEAADGPGTEPLLRGRETEVRQRSVRYTSLELTIAEAPQGNPLDADGNGEVSAADALRVINFLGRYGTTRLDELADRIREGGEGEEVTNDMLDEMRRLDTNRSGSISALDALVVVNDIGRQTLSSEIDEASAEGSQVIFPIRMLDDDEDD